MTKLGTLIVLAALSLPWACAQSTPARHPEPRPVTATTPLPEVGASQPANLPGLHNVVAYTPRVISGSVPEGAEGFETLAALGIKTVISVDGAKPEVAEAKAHGLRYVHLPVGYDGVPDEKGKAIAQALLSLPGPVYVHCHHGKHRSAGAAGAGCVIAGLLTPDEALARMKVSGTGAEYHGLFASVREARKTDLHEPVAAAAFPEVAEIRGLTEAMTEVDVVFDLIKAVRAAGYTVPKNHPDLVPQNEATRLATLLADSKEDPEVVAMPAAYRVLLDKSIAASRDLATSLSHEGTSREENEKRFKAVEKSCKECHSSYRDKKR